MNYMGLLTCAVLLAGKSWACVCGSPPPLTKAILSRYPYVALVKVQTMDDWLRPVGNRRPPPGRAGRFTVEVIENFRKALPDTFMLQSYRTSCDIGLRPGQTWVIFAKEVNGYATVFACDYSLPYRADQPVSAYEYLQSQSAEERLNTVRQLTGKPVVAADGRLEKFYANGQRALLTVYKPNGDEERTAWYANGRQQGKEFYKNGLRNGPATWWNANGTPLSTATFLAGIAVDTSRTWYNTDTLWLQSTPSLTEHARDSIRQFNQRSHLQSVTIADRQGRTLHDRRYDWYGRLTDETIGVPETGIECHTSFDKPGAIRSLMVFRLQKATAGELKRQLVYRMDYKKDGSRQVAYYDAQGRLTRWVRVKDSIETVLEEKRYPE